MIKSELLNNNCEYIFRYYVEFWNHEFTYFSANGHKIEK